MSQSKSFYLKKFYQVLYKEFGPQHWWPGQSAFEVIVGAILTQNTNWRNVEKAIVNLKKARILTPRAIKNIPTLRLAKLIKPSGFFNIKAQRLKNFTAFLFKKYNGQLKKMAKVPLESLREEILSIKGIGPETADSILLYAFHQPVFVVDAYTKRILYRHNMIDAKADYSKLQDFFMQNLRRDVKIYNEYHALLVQLGKHYCKTNPQCASCPLNTIHYSLTNRCNQCFRFLGGSHRKGRQTARSSGCPGC